MIGRAIRMVMVLALAAGSTASAGGAAAPAPAPSSTPGDPPLLPTGQRLTPLAAPGARFEPLTARIGPNPAYRADGAAAMAVSPDGRELIVLTSGFNRWVGPDGKVSLAQSGQYLLRYALGRAGTRWVQTLMVPNAYSGVAWGRGGAQIYVGGGVDDTVEVFDRTGRGADARFVRAAPIALGHKAGNGVSVRPQAAGVAVSPDGARLLVANYYNDSVSLIDLATRRVVAERDLRPGHNDPARAGQAGGEYPFAVAWRDNGHAWVSAPRDREVVALAVGANTLAVAARIAAQGEPTALLYDAARHRLYATEDNADRLLIADAAADRLLGEPRLGLPAGMSGRAPGKGFNPNSLAFAPGGRLLVTYGGINALALVEPGAGRGGGPSAGAGEARVLGLVPTGWYPSAAAISADGGRVFVVNRKSPPGPNPVGCMPRLATIKAQPDACGPANQYVFQLEKAGLLQFPLPSPRALAGLTEQVARNIGLDRAAERAQADAVMAALRARIRHVVFIVKENRTYDQVFGDMELGNGDPQLAILGKRLAPNHQQIARQFVLLDDFRDSGEQSSTGWTWTTAARSPDLLEKTAPVNYAERGLAYEAEHADRNIAAELSRAERRRVSPATPDDPDLLPGRRLLTAPDADGDDDDAKGTGFLWNAALRAGLSLRNYGFADASVYLDNTPGDIPPIRDPFGEGRKVYVAAATALAPYSDPWFRGFDQRLPDFWRVREWQREFAAQEAQDAMPALTLLRLSHDHFGDFKTAIDGVNTVETQMADNDYALGMVLETLSRSRFATSTLVFVIEDDAQNGADHVDARRSLALVAGAYVRRGALVSTPYTTINLLRTIEGVLGLAPLGLNDALALPMADLFDPAGEAGWSFRAAPAAVLSDTALPIPAGAYASATASGCPPRSAAWWAAAMAGQDFRREDRLDAAAFNRALWQGLGRGAEPVLRSGADLRTGRAALLAAHAPDCG